MTCENFLAGRVPCTCPEMDALMGESDRGLPQKKRTRTVVRTGKGAAVMTRCQVPGCGADISELKGYHRRHRVCLNCANAKEVVLDGVGKRYCQQCGKFHILSDFDEGKRSCRRKLERHNNRRRRKSNDPSVSVEKEPKGLVLSDDLACEEENGKDSSFLRSQLTEKAPLLESREGKISIPCSSPSPQNVLSDSVVTFAASDETQIDFEKDEPKSTPSAIYCDKKSGYSSVCPTGRISFKLYDWNPAEFPRRLRHQIFQWLASMPVELEGYIRPGCTVLTAFVAMPNFMWFKLLQEPVVYISDFVAGPEKLLSDRGTFFVYLDNMIFRVLRDGSSVKRLKVVERAPRLLYVHPTCFEAGKPIEFVACGSNLLQPNFRFLVSFAGKYLAYDYSVAPQHNDDEKVNAFDNQLLKINIPHTDPDLFGPAFIEVENQSGLSNFIPILIGNWEICSEMKIMEQRFDEPLCLKGVKLRVTGSPSDSCEVSSRQTSYSQFILDIAWLIKRPELEDIEHTSASFQIGRFNRSLNVLIKKKSTVVLARVLDYIETVVNEMKLNFLADELSGTDMDLLEKNIAHARQILSGLFKEDISLLQSRTLVHGVNCLCETIDSHSLISSPHQDSETTEERKSNGVSISEDDHGNVPLLNKEVIMNMTLIGDTPTRSLSCAFTRKYIFRPHVLAIASAAVCFCICAVFIHPQEVGRIATTIRRSLFDSST